MTKLSPTISSSIALGAVLLLPSLLLPSAAMAQSAGGFGGGQPQSTPAPVPVYNPAPPRPRSIDSERPPQLGSQPHQGAPAGPAMPQPARQQSDTPVTARPEGSSIGLGLNYTLDGNSSFNRPGGASARLRLASGLTMEPFVRLATHSQTLTALNSDTKNAQNELVVGTNVRLPLKRRGKVDLVALGGISAGSVTNDPDGGNNNDTTTTIGISYGLSVEYWYNANWCLSFSAQNPLVSYQSSVFEATNSPDSSSIDVGVIWNPLTELSLHLFY